MRDTPYSKTCNKTVRRFYDDFDLLPAELKKLLWELPYQPDFDDLKAAWELASEFYDMNDVIKRIKCLPKKPEPKLSLAEKRHQKWQEKWNKKNNRVAVYGYKLVDVDPKHARLVQRVKEEEAAALLARRTENKDIKPARYYQRVFLGWEDPHKREKERNARKGDKSAPEKVIQDHICKAMHNAGGKTGESAVPKKKTSPRA